MSEPGTPPSTPEKALSRRGFLQSVSTLAALGSAAVAAPPETVAAPSQPALPALPVAGPDNVVLRMQADIRRAMQKPIEQRRWVMAIDLRRCIGCSACTVACVAENKLPPGVVYRPVLEEEAGRYPTVTRSFLPRPCMHCDAPPCIPVCPVEPTKATRKRPDGVVEIDYETCIGCGLCAEACPYGARTVDGGQFYTEGTPRRQAYETEPSHEYGRAWARVGQNLPIDKARKCHFCVHRLEAGMLPACVTTCIGYATFFGDANDPQSLVAELAGRPNVMRYKEALGTKPTVFYLT
jgi:molybdopterin-containing oxidoreductase family iron-sulfur binding subunit